MAAPEQLMFIMTRKQLHDKLKVPAGLACDRRMISMDHSSLNRCTGPPHPKIVVPEMICHRYM